MPSLFGLHNFWETGDRNDQLPLQVKKWRGREVKSPVQGHTVSQWQSPDLNSNLTDSKILFLRHSTEGLQPGFRWFPTSEIRCTIMYKCVCIFNGESVPFIGFSKVVVPHLLIAYSMLPTWRWWPLSCVWKIGQGFIKWDGEASSGVGMKASWAEGRAHVGVC